MVKAKNLKKVDAPGQVVTILSGVLNSEGVIQVNIVIMRVAEYPEATHR